jgi:hypothetical protein
VTTHSITTITGVPMSKIPGGVRKRVNGQRPLLTLTCKRTREPPCLLLDPLDQAYSAAAGHAHAHGETKLTGRRILSAIRLFIAWPNRSRAKALWGRLDVR